MNWIDVRDSLPKLIGGDSEEVLCMTRKFGHEGVKNNSPYCAELLWWTGKKWASFRTDDFEANQDFYLVTHWLEIPDVNWSK